MIETELGILRRSHYSNELNSSMDGSDVIVRIEIYYTMYVLYKEKSENIEWFERMIFKPR